LIEPRKVNQRTGLPITGPEVTIPYGAIEHVDSDRDREKFHYLGGAVFVPPRSLRVRGECRRD
jgi:hypothetical protein